MDYNTISPKNAIQYKIRIIISRHIYLSNCRHMILYHTTIQQNLKHTTTLFSLSDHYILILSREWRVIVHLVQTNYHGRPMALKSVRCDRAACYEGSSLCPDVF